MVTFQEEMFVDVGVYGVPKNERFDAERTTRKVEEFVRSEKQSHSSTTQINYYLLCFLPVTFDRNVNGFQMMYADSYMTREEFRLMFDHTLYDKVSMVPVCGLLTSI